MFSLVLYELTQQASSGLHGIEPQFAKAAIGHASTKWRLPGEGVVYDRIGFSNFFDLNKHSLTATLAKSVHLNTFSKVFDADLPAKAELSGKLGTLGIDGFNVCPKARISLSIRLLDLGSDSRHKGYLRSKSSAGTDGRLNQSFEIDRKVELFGLPNTSLYGNVTHKISNRRNNGEWRTVSSFGLHQNFLILGFKFSGRVGLTPEGRIVFDLKT